jgi:RimJ/RimL family protein N-acetyltransferase
VIEMGEFRILRVGVLPAYRRQGINAGFYALLLRKLFSEGARRVYIDSSRNNVASLRAQRRAGFRTVGEILVRGRLLGSGVIRWRSAPEQLTRS